MKSSKEKMIHYDNFPGLSKYPNFSHDVHLKYLKGQIDEYIDKYGLNLNPDFQRGHVWTLKQRIAYMEFLVSGGRTGKDIYFNHEGWGRNYKGEFVIVDGLQRLTTILMFINNEFPIFGEYTYSQILGNLGMFITIKLHINDLNSREKVLKWYLETNSGTPHTEEELTRVAQMLEKEKDKNAELKSAKPEFCFEYKERQSDDTFNLVRVRKILEYSKTQMRFFKELSEINSKINNGRGCVVMFTVLKYLGLRDIENASNVICNESDKLSAYEELYKTLKTNWDEIFPNKAKIGWYK